jgi:hypothetical protein
MFGVHKNFFNDVYELEEENGGVGGYVKDHVLGKVFPNTLFQS